MPKQRAFVVVTPGLEPLLVDELRELGLGIGLGRARVVHGGVELDVTTRQLYLINRWSRLATRVLVRVASGSARRFDELEDIVGSVDWSAFVARGAPIVVRAASHASRLYHDGAIAERTVRVVDRAEGDDGQQIYVRVDHDRVTVSADASGDALHRRGWRLGGPPGVHAAPLRATLAAALVRASGYDGSAPLIDPMTGSGTIAIEAATSALRRPNERPFAFHHWPSFEPGTWASVTASSPPRTAVSAAAAVAPVFAGDRDAGAVALARAQVELAGVAGVVSVEHAALAAQQWPHEPGVVVCNPPYGHRLDPSHDLRNLYATLGRRARDGGHRLCVLGRDHRLARACGVDLVEWFVATNGGITVRCWVSVPA